MKVIIDDLEIIGNPEEIVELINIIQNQFKPITWDDIVSPRPEPNCTISGHRHQARYCPNK
jgi:hypothetical protein